MTTETEKPSYPFWKYEDLGFFAGSLVPVYVLALLLMRMTRLAGSAIGVLVFQALIYALLLGVLYALVALRYGYPFWRSLRWVGGFGRAWLCVVAGPLLAFFSAFLGVLLRSPAVPSPIENLLTDRRSVLAIAVFLIVLGPIIEELIYRGFLYPLLERSLGAWPAIVLTAVPFALMHGVQNQWAWQSLVVIGLAGVAFGYTRYRTHSTFASAMVHAGYNTTLFVAFLVQKAL
jgi:membrane protease YdiL (CAAX protease family)